MTDNGLAALAAALHERVCLRLYQPMDSHEIGHHGYFCDAAAILGERGVFLPDGLAPLFAASDAEAALLRLDIATLRAALERVRERVDGKRVAKVKAGEDRWQTGFRDGWNELLPTVLAIIDEERALATAKETP